MDSDFIDVDNMNGNNNSNGGGGGVTGKLITIGNNNHNNNHHNNHNISELNLVNNGNINATMVSSVSAGGIQNSGTYRLKKKMEELLASIGEMGKQIDHLNEEESKLNAHYRDVYEHIRQQESASRKSITDERNRLDKNVTDLFDQINKISDRLLTQNELSAANDSRVENAKQLISNKRKYFAEQNSNYESSIASAFKEPKVTSLMESMRSFTNTFTKLTKNYNVNNSFSKQLEIYNLQNNNNNNPNNSTSPQQVQQIQQQLSTQQIHQQQQQHQQTIKYTQPPPPQIQQQQQIQYQAPTHYEIIQQQQQSPNIPMVTPPSQSPPQQSQQPIYSNSHKVQQPPPPTQTIYATQQQQQPQQQSQQPPQQQQQSKSSKSVSKQQKQQQQQQKQQQQQQQQFSPYQSYKSVNSAIVGSNAPIPTLDHDHHCLSTIPSKAPRPSYQIHSPKSHKLAPTTFIPISPNSGKQLAQPHAAAIHKSVSSDSDEYYLSISNDSNRGEEILLPIDVLDLIFSQLSYTDRCTCAWVCTTWRCTLMMTPNPLLENCMISLHQPPPERKLLPIRHIINSLNITIAPCSCNFCYFHNDPYQFLKKWIDYLEPACFSSDLSKVTLRVFHNSTPEQPPPATAAAATIINQSSSPLTSQTASTCTSTDPAYANLTPQLQHECTVNHGFSRDYQQQRSHFFDLEKPLALPFHDLGAVIPLSILSSLLNSKIKELKIRVCIDLPYSKKKEDDYFKKIVKVENLSEIGLLTHDPLDPSFSAACKTSQTILDKVFSTLFASPLTFINLRRLYLVTTTIDKNVFNNFNSHLPSLEGLHLSVWNHDLVKLFEDITGIFGTKLKELGIRFTTCNGIKYSTSFSHRDRKLEDSMVELLATKCPNLTHFSFEGWLSNLSDSSLKSFGKLNLKHFVLKNGLDSRVCRPIWARLKLDPDNIGYDMISEKELKMFILSQTNLKVFEISASEIDKFISVTPITIEPHSPSSSSSNTASLMYRNMISDDFINSILDGCSKIQYIKIVDNTNYRTYLRGNRSKVSQQQHQPYSFQYGNYNNDYSNNDHHAHQSSMPHFHFHPNQTVDKRELLNLFQIN